MAILKTILIILLGLLAFSALYVRLAPSNPARWHGDPSSAPHPFTPNFAFLSLNHVKNPSPEFAVSAADLASRFDEIALGWDGSNKLAVSDNELLVTYIFRSRLMGFPDYLSVRFIALDDDRSTLEILSRARFGYSDRGVNRRRIKSLLNELQNRG